MSDNTRLNPGEGGDLYASDELATVNGQAAEAGLKVQRVKAGFGADGDLKDVSTDQPLPVSLYGEAVEALEAMRMAVQALTRSIGQAMPDANGRLRVNVELGALTASIAAAQTLATVTQVATLTNQTQIGGLAATEQIPSLMRLGADSLRRNVSVS